LEFSHVIAIKELGPSGVTLRLQATPGERAALGRRFGLLDLESLDVAVSLVVLAGSREGDVAVDLKGEFKADVVQECVVTLEPIKTRIEHPVVRRFVTDKLVIIKAARVDPLGDEPADVLIDEKLDVGEVIAEELALALDPYPRLPGVTLTSVSTNWTAGGSEAGEAKSSPFAILKDKVRRT
jgi:uncharacterized metal-binding protein YceD (DUF177 family)